YTVLFALAGSLVISLTLMPVLAFTSLPRKLDEKDVWLIRLAKWFYRPLIEAALAQPLLTAAAAVLVAAISIPIALRLGAEFMPKLEEGDILIEANRLPSST